jgi:two-component system chemotaxis sensor kinase CheA
MSNGIPESAMGEFFSEAEEIIARVNLNLAKFESSGRSEDIIDSLYRDIHTLKGSAQLFGFSGIGIIGHALEACLEPVRSKHIALADDLVNMAYACMDFIGRIIKDPEKDLKKDPSCAREIELFVAGLVEVATEAINGNYKFSSGATLPIDDHVQYRQELKRFLPTEYSPDSTFVGVSQPSSAKALLGQSKTNTNSHPKALLLSDASEKPMSQAPSTKEPISIKPKIDSENNDGSTSESSTIRVQINLLDRLMNLVGEMVLVRNQVLQYNQKNEDYEFLNLSQRLDLVTSELQENVMKTRMQPIGSVLTKFQRVVRDISRELNKQIEFTVKGAETELDKSLLESIKDPLTHIIRNSCDHGLESADDRRSAGKSETGHVLVRAFHEGGQVVIEITDDGRGLNLPKILAKAVEKKIVPAEKANSLSEREVAQLIFAPGFSTADQVSAISGRGVGMDVVKTNIEKAGGIVDLSTEMGKGTTLRLRIPLTLAIVPAMIVCSGKQFFAIPQVKLQELVRVDMDGDGPKIEFLQGQPIFRLRGQLLPLIFINNILNLTENPDHSESQVRILNIVVLAGDGDPFGLVVDEIRDTADIVVKPLPQFLKRLNVYSGATIMGDGTVSLILDVVGVAEKANIQTGTNKKATQEAQALATSRNVNQETQELLFFELNGLGKYCLPLILVQRLEEFSRSQIESSGKERIVKYRNSILPLISLNAYLKTKPAESSEISEKISVIVVSKRRRLFGIEVNQIFDVINLSSEIETPLQETPGVLGNVISGDEIATVVDVLGIIEDIIGSDPAGIQGAQKTITPLKSKKPLRILFAEDTPFFVKHVQKILTDLNIECVHALDGEAAMKILRSSTPEKFDLILSDIEMPNMNGFQLAEFVRKDAHWNKIPMIALTTRFREADVKKGLESGFNQYLEKLKADQLVEAIKTQLGGIVA